MRPCAGYSLIELSITVALIGVVTATGLHISAQQKEKEALRETNRRLDEIEDALVRFTSQYDRLPCPASPTVAPDNNSPSFGVEEDCSTITPSNDVEDAHSGGNNAVWFGVVPTRTLGLPIDMAVDAWNLRFTYAIYKKSADDSIDFRDLEVDDLNDMIVIEDMFGNQLNPNDTLNPVAYVLVSHGKRKPGAYSEEGILVETLSQRCRDTEPQRDIENCDHINGAANDSIFVDMDISDGSIAAEYYDDLIRWRTKSMFGDVALP